MIPTGIQATLFGITIGLIYSRSFVEQQRSAFFGNRHTSIILFFVIRMALLMICAFYLLRSPLQDSILVLISFIMTFWIFLLLKKARLHGGS